MPTNAACDPSCERAPKPGPLGYELTGIMQHGWHQAGCTFHRTLNTRHDQYLEAIAKTARKDLGLLALTGEYLNKDYKSRRSTDLYVVFPGSVDEMPVSMD